MSDVMQSPKPKRQKVAKACNPCRRRKVKCDGVEPVCNKCKEVVGGPATCTWESSSAHALSQAQAEHIRRLEDRVRQLERSSDGIRIGKPSKFTGATLDTLPEASRLYRDSSSSTADVGPNDPLVAHRPPYPDAGHSILISGEYTPAILGAVAGEHEGEAFYGSSSAGTFMQNVKLLAKQTLGRGGDDRSSNLDETNDSSVSNVRWKAPEHSHKDYVLPSRRTADQLLSTYWQYVHSMYPILDELQTQRDYEKVWNGEGSVANERSFLCSLNAIFAIASQLSGPTTLGEREASAAVFSKRAEQCWDLLDPPTLRSVQAYLLLGLYFQSTHEPHRCWLLVGLAIRTAQSLGLHHPETSARAPNVSRGELMRRVWYGCVLMDRVLSMTYGRPCEIGPGTATVVPLPLAVQALHAPELHSNPSADFFLSMLKLNDILHDVLRHFYRIDDRTKPAGGLLIRCFGGSSSFSVFDIDQRLSEWEDDLPDYLKLYDRPVEHDVESNWHRQAVVLRQRQLHVKLLLLRPVLSYYVNADIQQAGAAELSTLFQQILLQCAIACVKAAQEAIQLIAQEKSPLRGAVGAVDVWWFNVLFLYSSAACLVAARLTTAVQVEIPEESIHASWRRCLEVLGEYSTFNTSLRRLIATLNILFDAVPRQYSRLRASSTEAQGHGQADSTDQGYATSLPLLALEGDRDTVPAQLSPDFMTGYSWLNDQFPFVIPGDFDFGFDPNDLSWLTTIPMQL